MRLTHEQIERAEQIALERVKAAGFADVLLNGLVLLKYTDEELVAIDKGQWAGMYATQSVDSKYGLIVGVNIDKHEDEQDLADTICHEIGHALWELLDKNSQKMWENADRKLGTEEYQPWGAQEAFADTFMHLCNGKIKFMIHPNIFNEIVQPTSEVTRYVETQ
jgi:hypothetical protein